MSGDRVVDPATTLAAAFEAQIVGHSSDFNGGRISPDTARELASLALATLDEGYAVVKLPEVGDDDTWLSGQVWSGARDRVRCYLDDSRMSASEARELAAALLAAAAEGEVS